MLEGWQFTPEGAAVHPGEQTAVIADVHLGLRMGPGAAGDCVIAHSLEETLARLSTLLDRSMLSATDCRRRPARIVSALP